MPFEQQKIEDQFGDYGLEEIVESIEPDEEGNRDYLTEIEDEPQDNIDVQKLDESEKIKYSPDNIDQINRLYVAHRRFIARDMWEPLA